ncbi:MAG: SDR family oxidoreductase [Anaerolineae bacterium]|nr:SDR family oxidoreductase [Thermoflexales bacterium]MDW8408977.1 SDR family oxidoreductase [Anaerolineae bacterium]
MSNMSVLITGASSGIGRATALMLAERGAALTLAARNYAALTDVTEQARRLGGQAIAVPVDVTQRAQVIELVSEAAATYGRIDGLVNCAGQGVLRPALDLTDEDIDRMLAVNTKGVLVVTQIVVGHMLKTAALRATGRPVGRVITPVGTMGRYVMRGSAAYSASKWGAAGALKAMATEFQRQGIQFTLLYFGGVDSPFWDAIDMPVQRDKMLRPQDAADAIVRALEAPAYSVLNEIVLQPESHQFL